MLLGGASEIVNGVVNVGHAGHGRWVAVEEVHVNINLGEALWTHEVPFLVLEFLERDVDVLAALGTVDMHL